MVPERRRDLMAAMLRFGILSMIVMPATARNYKFDAPSSQFAVCCQAVVTCKKMENRFSRLTACPSGRVFRRVKRGALPARLNEEKKGVRTASPPERSQPELAVCRRDVLLHCWPPANECVLRPSTPLLSCFIGRRVGELLFCLSFF